MKKLALIHYRTAEGSYGSLSLEVAAAAGVREIISWALQRVPSGSLVISYRFEARPEYPEETILRGMELGTETSGVGSSGFSW